MNVRRLASVAGLLLALPVTACSSDAPPAETVPDLAAQLEQVDAAVADGDYAKARTAVDALVARTAQAEVADEITDDEADRILDAARHVLVNLPDASDNPTEPPEQSGSTPPAPTQPIPEDADDEDVDDHPGSGNDDKQDKGQDDEKKEKGEEKGGD